MKKRKHRNQIRHQLFNIPLGNQISHLRIFCFLLVVLFNLMIFTWARVVNSGGGGHRWQLGLPKESLPRDPLFHSVSISAPTGLPVLFAWCILAQCFSGHAKGVDQLRVQPVREKEMGRF